MFYGRASDFGMFNYDETLDVGPIPETLHHQLIILNQGVEAGNKKAEQEDG